MEKSQQTDKMRVSFDLDEVLFVFPDAVEAEPALKFPWNRMYRERLRLGTPELIHELQALGYEVWVYTSSFRSERYIRQLFRHERRFPVSVRQHRNGFHNPSDVHRGAFPLPPDDAHPLDQQVGQKEMRWKRGLS